MKYVRMSSNRNGSWFSLFDTKNFTRLVQLAVEPPPPRHA